MNRLSCKRFFNVNLPKFRFEKDAIEAACFLRGIVYRNGQTSENRIAQRIFFLKSEQHTKSVF